jgi:hypothetical protein
MNRQAGVVLPLFAISAAALLAVAALALDVSFAYTDKTRLQNALDAAALAGAKVLNSTGSTTLAQAAAQEAFDTNVTANMGVDTASLDVAMSATLVPFVPGSAEPRYLRARFDNLAVPAWFAGAVPGVEPLQVGGSAIAGPIPVAPCEVVPLLACADPADTDCSDGHCYGYAVGVEQETVLKSGSGSSGWEVGPGNFQLLAIGCTGADCLRESLAGSGRCVDPDGSVSTEPGNTVGPTAQGINTRLNIYNGPVSSDEYPPDLVSHYETSGGQNQFWYDDYQARYASEAFDAPGGAAERRILQVVLGNCTGTESGRGEVEVLQMGCFFLTRPAKQGGDQAVYGQFLSACESQGVAPEDPSAVKLPTYEIVLYKDSARDDS